MKKLLITDLDNTLYDWVSFYAQSFSAMVEKISEITKIPVIELQEGFQKVHQKHHSSEHPFAALEVDMLIEYFKTSDKDKLKEYLDTAFHAFNSCRKDTLRCYDTVQQTLEKLSEQGVIIVGHTEAPVRNALHRLEFLELTKYFKHLYTPRDLHHNELSHDSIRWISSYGDFIKLLEPEDRKPNPHLLRSICANESIQCDEAVYVGDSIVKDISMAKDANLTAVWAQYGKQHSSEYWKTLVSITHWTERDVAREEQLQQALGEVKPDLSINSFSQLLKIDWHTN
ncbi:HAD family hydrolase [Vibrio cholerae]|uniref:HAD family hydrolase n=1 Tax=Vibrio TaxID=662 RepID=UPI000A11741C|nr:HAD-IA family hydrolase [Vibrio cholerae]EGR1140531.1 HAD family hydrolase [Vibrio cholerae]EGR2516250.1 HAD family hydrolase [Vibrio cholerae]MCU4220758.1 HAD-IA family hydrolase [Vibrio cholerae]ORP14951.1 haloacid dehalogenase [Vibrio cholerae]HCZ9576139.1 HAD family hydrolase [Vibrio cholerae]